MARQKRTIKGKKAGVAIHTNSQHTGVNPIAVGVMGAVAGAAVGATAAVVLADEKTRNKIGDVVNNLSKNAPRMMDEGRQRMHEIRERAADMIADAQDRLGDRETRELKSGKTKS